MWNVESGAIIDLHSLFFIAGPISMLGRAGLPPAPGSQPWQWQHQSQTPPMVTLESTLERLRLPKTYAPALFSLLGSWETILELDQSRLAMPVPLILPAEHSARFVGHCAMLKQKREARRNMPAVYGDVRWSPLPGYSFLELDSQSYSHFEAAPAGSPMSGSRRSRSLPSSYTPEPDTRAGPFDCFALVGQSLRTAFDQAFPKKALG